MKKDNIKTVIITGGSKGIGADIAREFYKEGWNVFIGARHDNGLAQELGEKAFFVRMDVQREKDHIKISEIAIKKTGNLNSYINCAGFSQWKAIENVTENFWNRMMDTNLKGVMWGCKTAAKYLSKKGSIINISSLAGRRGSANNSVYCASKFGVTGLTQSLAKELGVKGIRVTAICPVYVKTEGVLEALKDPISPAKGKNVQFYLKNFTKQQCALGKLPEGREVAKTCLFFASESASAITGQSLNVDCGVLPQ